MDKETYPQCGREPISIIKTDIGYVCYNCYTEKNLSRKPEKQNTEQNPDNGIKPEISDRNNEGSSKSEFEEE